MTNGDRSAPPPSPRPTRTTAKKASGTTGKTSRAGSNKTSTAKKRAPRADSAEREADVLERLNKLADPGPVEEILAPMPIPLPAIVEADPSVPMPTPNVEQLAAAEAADVSAPLRVPIPPAEEPASSAVDASIDTMLTDTVAPAPVEVLDPSGPMFFTPDLGPPVADRTDVFPRVAPGPAPAPTEAMPATVIGEDVDGSFGLVLPQRPLQRPVAFRRGKPRVRRVTRVVRHVDPWSVFKVALVFNAILFVVCLTSGVLLWNVANATGTVDNVENFFEQFGWSTFEFHGGELYHNAWIAGLFGAIFLTGMAVFLATVFNLITDLVGGIRVSVLEEEVLARAPGHPVTRIAQPSVADPVEPG